MSRARKAPRPKRGGVHAVDPYGHPLGHPLCGAPFTFATWTTRKRSGVTCPRCLHLLASFPTSKKKGPTP